MIKDTVAAIHLCKELEAWCKAQELPYLRADDLALLPYLTVAQKTWLVEFGSRWELLKVKQQLDQYFLCVKSGKKWIAVAGINLGPNSCIARASHAFADAGYETWGNKVCWADPMSKQANYGGKSLNYKTLPAPIETVV